MGRRKRDLAIRTDATGRVEVDAAALRALVIRQRRTHEAEILDYEDVLGKGTGCVQVGQHISRECLKDKTVLLGNRGEVLHDVSRRIRLAIRAVRREPA